MTSHTHDQGKRRVARALDFSNVVGAIRRRLNVWTDPKARRDARSRRELHATQGRRAAEFALRYAEAVGFAVGSAPAGAKRVLVIGGGSCGRAEVSLSLIKALGLRGCWPIPMIVQSPELFSRYYRLIDTGEMHLWRNFCDPAPFRSEAAAVVDAMHSTEEIARLTRGATRVGGHAISTTRRKLHLGTLDLGVEQVRSRLEHDLAVSMASAEAAERIVTELKPSVILTEDTAYTPRGEIFEICVDAGIPVIRYYTAHKSSALMLKRYTAANRDQDLNSLSDASWRAAREMEWDGERREELWNELGGSYAKGLWYNENGQQFDRRMLDAGVVRERLRLDPAKKTAFIFPHIAWDASFGRGQDLFESYDEWFVAVVRAACANPDLQWVVKIYPAHVGKSLGERPAEEETLRRRIGPLPPHVSLLTASNEISTFSLFPLMDYCLTVRGTVGLEAACRGIPVLTGGTGRYDRKGFTTDPTSAAELLERVARIEELPRLTPAQIELAERYAYGLFLLRPLPMSSVTLEYDKKHGAVNFFDRVQINVQSLEDWRNAGDLTAFADWVLELDEEDFLLPAPKSAGR